MKDQQIIDLYFARDEQAIVETDKEYGAACMRISLNILNSRPDAEECVSDTYLGVWNSIPPQRPAHFGAFVCRIARNLSLKRFRDLHRQRRNRDLEVAMEDLAAVAAPQRTDPLSWPGISRIFSKCKTSRIAYFLWDVISICVR